MSKRFGALIAAMRKIKGWTQKDLAQEMTRRGVTLTREAVSQMEQGSVQQPDIAAINVLAAIFPVTVEELCAELGYELERGRPLPGESEVTALLRLVDPGLRSVYIEGCRGIARGLLAVRPSNRISAAAGTPGGPQGVSAPQG